MKPHRRWYSREINHVYVSIKDAEQKSLILAALRRAGCVANDAYSAGNLRWPIDFHYQFCLISDSDSCRELEKFLRSWYLETEDNKPLFFLGDWHPSFYSRSIIDINDFSFRQLVRLLRQTKKYVTRVNSRWRPIVLYPHQRYMDSDFDPTVEGA